MLPQFTVKIIPLTLIFLLVGCSQNTNNPGKVAVEMFEQVCRKNDYSVMLDFVAPESAAIMAVGIAFMEDKGEATDQSYCKTKIKIISEDAKNDMAVVVLSDPDEPMNWKKIDGEWKFFIQK